MVLAFLNGLINTALVGIVARFVLGFLLAQPSARLGAVCAAAGFAVGRYSYAGPFGQDALAAGSAALGSLIAVVALCFLPPKRPRGQKNSQEE